MICPRCKLDNLAGATFCESCGASLTETIPLQESPNLQAELEEKIDEMKTHLQDALKLDPDKMKEHLNQLRENLKLGKGSFKERLAKFRKNFKMRSLEDIIKENEKSFKNMFISFIAWAILKFSTPYHRRIVVFLLSPYGLLVLLTIGYIYGAFQKEINLKVKEMKGSEKNASVSE